MHILPLDIKTIQAIYDRICNLKNKIARQWKEFGRPVVKLNYIVFLYTQYTERVAGNAKRAARILEQLNRN